MKREPLPLGFIVEPWGKVCAVGCRDGERYYMLLDEDDIMLMPADVVEQHVALNKGEPK